MTVIVMHDECNGWALKMRVRDWKAAARGQVNKREAYDARKSCSHEVDGLPNGSRLSCGRLARPRKSSRRQSVPATAHTPASLTAITARQLQALVRQQCHRS